MKTIILLFFISFTAFCFSQENDQERKIKYHSFSVTPLGGYFDESNGGLVLNGDVSFGLRKHVFSLGFLGGTEFNILGSSDGFEQVNLFYGRELNVLRNLFLDLHVGAGYFSFSSTNREQGKLIDERRTTIGFPVMTKFRIIVDNRLSMGLQLQANINSVRTIYSVGIVFHWNRR